MGIWTYLLLLMQYFEVQRAKKEKAQLCYPEDPALIHCTQIWVRNICKNCQKYLSVTGIQDDKEFSFPNKDR